MNEELKEYIKTGKKNLILIYILYLCSVVVPVLCIIGAIFAYINQETNDRFLKSHYIFAIRTFWIGFIGIILSVITMIIFIGPIIYILVCIWFVVRVVIALRLLINDQEHLNPKTLWFS